MTPQAVFVICVLVCAFILFIAGRMRPAVRFYQYCCCRLFFYTGHSASVQTDESRPVQNSSSHGLYSSDWCQPFPDRRFPRISDALRSSGNLSCAGAWRLYRRQLLQIRDRSQSDRICCNPFTGTVIMAILDAFCDFALSHR